MIDFNIRLLCCFFFHFRVTFFLLGSTVSFYFASLTRRLCSWTLISVCAIVCVAVIIIAVIISVVIVVIVVSAVCRQIDHVGICSKAILFWNWLRLYLPFFMIRYTPLSVLKLPVSASASLVTVLSDMIVSFVLHFSFCTSVITSQLAESFFGC